MSASSSSSLHYTSTTTSIIKSLFAPFLTHACTELVGATCDCSLTIIMVHRHFPKVARPSSIHTQADPGPGPILTLNSILHKYNNVCWRCTYLSIWMLCKQPAHKKDWEEKNVSIYYRQNRCHRPLPFPFHFLFALRIFKRNALDITPPQTPYVLSQ